MAIQVSFGPPGYIGDVSNLVIGKMRKAESVTVGGATTAAAQDGEWAWVYNGESSAVHVAHGPTPNAAATTETAFTTARYAVPAGQSVPVALSTGDKIDTAAIS